MAFRLNQTSLLGLLCIALLLSSGVAQNWDLPGLICQEGKCPGNKQCAQSCVSKGFKNGGACIADVPGLNVCCCLK